MESQLNALQLFQVCMVFLGVATESSDDIPDQPPLPNDVCISSISKVLSELVEKGNEKDVTGSQQSSEGSEAMDVDENEMADLLLLNCLYECLHIILLEDIYKVIMVNSYRGVVFCIRTPPICLYVCISIYIESKLM